jgi:glycine oxidase
MSDKRKFLIVGAGLSGLSVALQLIRKGAEVTVIDNQINHSSLVAAGMMNPLVFKRMTKGWRVDDFIPYLKTFYSSIEEETNSSFFRPIPIRRMFSAENEREMWLERQTDNRFTAYMETVTEEDETYYKVKNDFGSGRLKNTYVVDAAAFLAASKLLVERQGTLLNESFSYQNLVGTTYNKELYTDVIFCEGYLGINNPWFDFLPLDPTKGELLTIRSAQLPEDESINRKCFNLPIGNGQFKVGSTIDWGNQTTHTTEEGKKKILKKLSVLIDEKVEVIEHQAGVRPGSKDRRPFIGSHPQHTSYHIFNGLGSKGYMLAPLLSAEFASYLLEDSVLDSEVDLSRFYPGI